MVILCLKMMRMLLFFQMLQFTSEIGNNSIFLIYNPIFLDLSFGQGLIFLRYGLIFLSEFCFQNNSFPPELSRKVIYYSQVIMPLPLGSGSSKYSSATCTIAASMAACILFVTLFRFFGSIVVCLDVISITTI